jgi:Galactose oxidase, central domain
MSTARYSPTATRLGSGRVLVVGGEPDNSRPSTAELYDPPTGTWLPGGTLNEPRALHVAVRLTDGRVLVAGGGSYTASAELYDPASGRWNTTGGMTGYGGTAALLQDGRVLVAGYSNEGEVYSPATGTWTATGPVVSPGLWGRAAALLPNGQVLYAGGERFYCGVKNCFNEPSANAELYTP